MIECFRRQTQLAAGLMADHLSPGDSTIDATAGTGADTLMLAKAVGERGQVYAFDIQEEALLATRHRLEAAGCGDWVRLYHEGHENLGGVAEIKADPRIAGIMFNLGYYPGGDHTITTQVETTMEALKAGLKVMAPGGLMTLCVYTHAQGRLEGEAVKKWCTALKDGIDVHCIQTINHRNAPVLYLINKVKA